MGERTVNGERTANGRADREPRAHGEWASAWRMVLVLS